VISSTALIIRIASTIDRCLAMMSSRKIVEGEDGVSMDDTAKNDDLLAMLNGPLEGLLSYCRKNNWSGFDPYDGLNSRLYQATPLKKSKICRLALIQILKRLPINLRPMLLVPKEQNPKAIALFLTAFVKLSRSRVLIVDDLINEMTALLADMRSPDASYWSWGYSFPWQTRGELVPRGAANLVCTVFVSNALLDAYEYNRDPRCLLMATSAADYLVNELYWTEGDSIACFSYPLPHMRVPIHNANFLGAAVLCRISKHSGEKKYLERALKVARYSAAKQQHDGSWGYGELSTQKWIDNFHTGYNLCALRTISECAATEEFSSHLQLGFEFYREHFFREDGAPRYFQDRTYPIDIHSVAQSIITMLQLKDMDRKNLEQACVVLKWALEHMWDRKGYFYYQVLPFFTNRIPYMRWSQAWMLLALSTFAASIHEKQSQEVTA